MLNNRSTGAEVAGMASNDCATRERIGILEVFFFSRKPVDSHLALELALVNTWISLIDDDCCWFAAGNFPLRVALCHNK